jgi:transcriptional regulator with XRE-family HTH domain
MSRSETADTAAATAAPARRRTHRRVVPEWREDLLGLPYPVILENAVIEKVDDATGAVLGNAIPDLDALAETLAVVRVFLPVRLSAPEVRFLRNAVKMTGRQLAAALGLTPETVSRWENGKISVGEYTERLLRHVIAAELTDRVPALALDPKDLNRLKVVAEWPEGAPPEFRFRRVKLKHAGSGAVTDEWDTDGRQAA